MENRLEKTLRHNEEVIEKIRENFVASPIASNIVCLIVHGSSLFYPIEKGDKYSDIDLEIVLNKRTSEDYKEIKSLCEGYDVLVEPQFRYIWEIIPKQGLIYSSKYGIFDYFEYVNGICLIGENIYPELVKNLSEEDIKQSLLVKSQILFKDIRKTYCRNNDNHIILKNIMRFFNDVCFYEGFVDYKDLCTEKYFKQVENSFVDALIKGYENELSKEDKDILGRFKYDHPRNVLKEEVFSVVEKVFDIFNDRNLREKVL